MVALALIPLVQALLIGHGSRHRAYLAQQEAGQEDGEGTGARAPGDQGRAAGAGGAELRQWSRGEALRDPRFYLVLLPVLGPGLIGTAVFFHQAELARAQGWTLSYFAGQFPVFAGFTIAASLSAGVLVDWLTARRLASVVCLPMAAGLLLIAASAHPAVAPVFMALMGVSMGLVLATMGAVWPELYGTRHLGAIRSLVMASVVLATAIAPILTGVLIDLGVSWAAIALGYAAYALGASAAALPVGGRLAG